MAGSGYLTANDDGVSPESLFQLSLRFRRFWDANGDLLDPSSFLASVEDEVERLRRLGAMLIEFPAEVCSRNSAYASTGLWQDVAQRLRRHGVGATVHLPSTWVDLSSLDSHVWEGSIRSVEVAMEAVLPLGPVLTVVHPANHSSGAMLRSLPTPRRERITEQMAERIVTALRRLRNAPGGSVLAVENLEGTPIDLIVQVARHAGVGICVDVGHAVSDGADPVHFIRAAADLMRGVHVHDAVPSDTPGHTGHAHLPLGGGILDLASVMRTLIETGFRGPVIIEDRGDSEASAVRFLAAAATVSAS